MTSRSLPIMAALVALAALAVVAADEEPEPLICEPGGGGMFLPLFGDSEQHWPNGIRVICYFLGLVWMFAAVAIVADVFMSGIETITSQTKYITVYEKDGSKQGYQVQVWNDTIANLSLMALGSSAPEILLSCIELTGNEMYSGELGPSTIVGSAAFNLLCILAVCVMAIPEGESRKIKQYDVFVVTAICSVAAYVWLVVILVVTSPNIVTPIEGILTFLFFPGLLATAYAADRGTFSKKAKQGMVLSVNGLDGGSASLDADEMMAIGKRVKERFGDEMWEDMSKNQPEKLAEYISAEASKQTPKSRAYYRVNATRQMTGGARVIKDAGEYQVLSEYPSDQMTSRGSKAPVIMFESEEYSVLEGVASGEVVLTVIRTGDCKGDASVDYKSEDGTATGGSDYKPVQGTLTFKSGERSQTITVGIIDDQDVEDDEYFYVNLSNLKVANGIELEVTKVSCKVNVLNDDFPGSFQFETPEMTVRESEKEALIKVNRMEGVSGEVTVKYSTQDGTAMVGSDYKETSGTLVFGHGELTKTIAVPVIDSEQYESSEFFFVNLSEPGGGAKLIGSEENDHLSCKVNVESDAAMKGALDGMLSMFSINSDKLEMGTNTWEEQFQSALKIESDNDSPSALDYFGYIMTLPWKLIFALIPPTCFAGGWACFGIALVMVGLVTCIIGDLASLLGCCAGMPDALTAITLVALGTSLPDTFASKAAATGDPFADNSIGNVTGSNSVNVFLGLGLPWMIGALYWASHGDNIPQEWTDKYGDIPGIQFGFAVPAGSLGASVTVFCCCCVACLGTLVYRRKAYGCELGGPEEPKKKTAMFFVSLWLIYLIFSAVLIFKEAAAK